MDKKTLKTIFIVIGSGIGGILLFIAAVIGFAYYKFFDPETSSFIPTPSQDIVSAPPEITEKDRFHGSGGMSSGSFARNKDKVLAEGKGKIIGRITAGKEPVKGLRLRLALNGSVMSQWGVSNSDGKYTIKVPFGKYRIDGYELDYSSAYLALPGKTDNPGNAYSSGTMLVDENKIGRGLDLDFVNPVIKLEPIGEASLSEPIIITWEPYPEAKAYKIQIIEKKNPRDYMDQTRLFEWSDLPIVNEPSFNVAEHGIKLKKDYYYTVEIDALGENKRKISEASSRPGRADFLVIE